jgi:hypothetical protein
MPMTWGSASDGLVCASAKLVLPSENGPNDELVGFNVVRDENVIRDAVRSGRHGCRCAERVI